MNETLEQLISSAPPEVRAHFIRKTAERGEIILFPELHQGTLYLLLEGQADVYKEMDNGNEVTFTTYEAGEVFGELELFSDDISTAYIAAKTPCEMILVDREYALFWMGKDFPFTLFLCKKLVRNVKSLTDNLSPYKPLPLRYRILSILLSRQRMGTLPGLTKKDLCRYLGTDIRCVNRIVKEFEEKGFLRYQNKRFSVTEATRAAEAMSVLKKERR